VGSNSEIQGYNLYPILHFHRKFSSGITADGGLIECSKAHKWFTDYFNSELVTVCKGGYLRDTM